MKTAVITVLLVLGLMLATATAGSSAPRGRDLEKRAAETGGEEDNHDEDEHGHEEDEHGHEEENTCGVSHETFSHEFTELAEEMNFVGENGQHCVLEEHHDEDEGNETVEDPLCEQTALFLGEFLVRLNLTHRCCLNDSLACENDETPTPGGSGRTDPAKAYGYGFLLAVLVCLGSLVGLLFLPFAKHPKFKPYYNFVYALLLALGASALFSDAVLHLIPEAFGLHGHEEEAESGDGHAHTDEEAADELLIVWRSCIVILGLYAFFLFEFVLHTWNIHSHSHVASDEQEFLTLANGNSPPQNKTEESNVSEKKGNLTGLTSNILHPSEEDECSKENCTDKTHKKNFFLRIKPLAWLIIIGDAIHNFADGLALGAAISQSLSLGISTAIALIFHEIPHEIGDYFILLSTGMSWYVALLFNFFSALTALVGFFIGVAVGTNSEDANTWILALAAGVFIYIALVDLLPQLILIKEKGCGRRFVIFVMINIGFFLSFLALLLLAIYEEQLNSLVTV